MSEDKIINLNEIQAQSQKIFREVFDDDELTISSDTSANDIDEWDSLSHIRLIISHEIQFNIKFMANEIENCNNVGEFHNLIINKLNQNE